MAHFKIDPITFFLDKTGRFPTKTQQNIINAMDSCQFTLIPYKRQYGITTALSHYAEWEFLYSEGPIEITFAVNNKYAVDRLFLNLEQMKRARGVYKEGYKTLEVETLKSVLRPEYMRGSMLSDVYIFDFHDRTNDEYLFELIHISRSRVGQRREYVARMSAYQSMDDVPMVHQTKIYDGARFVVVCDYVDDMADLLLHAGVDEDDIGIVDMSASNFGIGMYSRFTPGVFLPDFVGIQPMTAQTGQIFKMNPTYMQPVKPTNYGLTYSP